MDLFSLDFTLISSMGQAAHRGMDGEYAALYEKDLEEYKAKSARGVKIGVETPSISGFSGSGHSSSMRHPSERELREAAIGRWLLSQKARLPLKPSIPSDEEETEGASTKVTSKLSTVSGAGAGKRTHLVAELTGLGPGIDDEE